MGHRGAAAHAPENTIAGFRVAARLGAPWVEFDVRLTADARCAVLHDDTLERTTGAAGRIDETPRAALSGLDAGSWFGPDFAGEPVPTLEAALEIISRHGMGANIELKGCPGREPEMVEAVSAAVTRNWPKAAPPALISSFDDNLLGIAKSAAPALRRAFIVRRPPRNWRRLTAELDCVSIHCDQRHLTQARVRRIKEANLALVAWVVDDPGRARALWDWGVDCILTGAPDVIGRAWKDRRAQA